MKIKTKQTVEKEVEVDVELPYFFKHNYGSIRPVYFALFDEERAMRLDDNEIKCYETEVAICSIANERFAECTEAEFTQAFEETMEHIQSMIPVTK